LVEEGVHGLSVFRRAAWVRQVRACGDR
jgi:hypothetical protein